MSRFLLFLHILILLTASASLTAHALDVNGVRIAKHSDKTRIVLDLDAQANFTAFALENPYRLVVDMPKFDWNAPTQVQQSGSSLIASIRHGVLSSDTSRVVFDLRNNVELIKSFALPSVSSKPHRIVLDVVERPAVAKVSLSSPAASTQPTSLLKPKVIQASTARSVPEPKAVKPQKARRKIIVIDPGHGGKDPGAVSGRTYEKRIALSLSKALKKELDATGKYIVHLTRSDDRYIKLHERVKIARRKNADLFVSIHADSLRRKSVRGASVYTLSEKASDAQTAKLAAKENKVDLIHGIDLTHEDKEVAGILLDLVQRDTMNQSNFFAEKLVDAFNGSGIRMLDNPHRSAGFAVLKAPDIPSVLIEAGFLSNASDAKLLVKSSHQRKIAKTIAAGIRSYLQN